MTNPDGAAEYTDGVNRRSLKFSEEFVAPVLKGEKTATVRYKLEGDVSVGDELRAETSDGTHFATIEITRTGECLVVEAPSLIELFGASHSADSAEDLIESLRQHYDTGFSPGTIVHVVVFEVVLRE